MIMIKLLNHDTVTSVSRMFPMSSAFDGESCAAGSAERVERPVAIVSLLLGGDVYVVAFLRDISIFDVGACVFLP